LVSSALSVSRRPEDVQESRQFFYHPGSCAARAQAVIDPLAADAGALPQSIELHVRWLEVCGKFGGKIAQLPLPPDQFAVPRRRNPADGASGGRNHRAN